MENKKTVKIAVLVSGGGTNLQALIDAQNNGIIKSGEIKLVISNKTINRIVNDVVERISTIGEVVVAKPAA